MSSSSCRSRRFHVRRQPVVVDIGCSCRKPKLWSLLNLSRLNMNHVSSKSSRNSSEYSSSTTCSLATTTITNSTFSPRNDTTASPASSSSYARSPNKNKKKEKKKKKKGAAEESVAVEKVSSDPYLDFKESMLQMIVEKEMYEWDELRELLNLFLSLNSPYHHHLILRAFAEIWEGVFSPPPAPR